MTDEAIITANSDKATQGEATASAATEPGHLVERANADGDYGPHGTVGGPAGPVFAGMAFNPELEKADTIPLDERFTLWHVPRGSGVRVDALSGAAVTENAYVVSNGDGRVIDYDAAAHDAGSIVGQATEATAGADERVEIEV